MSNYIDIPDIREPLWMGNQGRHVGIAAYRITEPSQVYRFGISWKNKADEQRYPKKYVMRGRDIQRYEAKPLKKYPDTYIHWIPIADLTTEIAKDICIEHNHILLADGRCPVEIPDGMVIVPVPDEYTKDHKNREQRRAE